MSTATAEDSGHKEMMALLKLADEDPRTAGMLSRKVTMADTEENTSLLKEVHVPCSRRPVGGNDGDGGGGGKPEAAAVMAATAAGGTRKSTDADVAMELGTT